METDPRLDKLRELPPIAPAPRLVDDVARAGLALLDDKAQPAWRSNLELARDWTFRAALPSALAGATVIYLSWAIDAASRLY